MSTSRRVILLNVLKLVDLALMVGSFLLATLLILRESNAMTFSDCFSMRVKVGNFVLFFVLLMLWHLIFSAFGLYHSRRLSGRTADTIDTFKATTVGTLLIAVAALVFRIQMISPSFLLVFWATATAVTVIHRLLLRSVLERICFKGRNNS
jgi:FlaA1/EpsC-like NDP-sugar epimerase